MAVQSFNHHAFQKKHMNNYLDNYNLGDKVTIVGKIKSKVFTNSSNGYSVYSMSVAKDIEIGLDGKEVDHLVKGDIRISGYSVMEVNQHFRVVGVVTNYKGLKQLHLETSEYIEPTTSENIIAFLSSGLISGIGEKTAEKIVNGYTKKGLFIEGFGDCTLEVIKESPMELTRIAGITPAKAQKISDAYIKNIEYQAVMMFFQKYGISPSRIMKIYKTYREKSIEIVKKNPFSLAKDIKGFAFRTCDDIARKLGQSPHSANRIKQGIIYTLQEATTQGHCYLTESQLITAATLNLSIIIPLDEAKKLLIENPNKQMINYKLDNLKYDINPLWLLNQIKNIEDSRNRGVDIKIVVDAISQEEIAEALASMSSDNALKIISYKGEKCIYLKEIYEIEEDTAYHIQRILRSKPEKFNIDIDKFIDEFENLKGFKLELNQRRAVKGVFLNNLEIITGGAGTGKSTVIEAIIYVLQKAYGDINFFNFTSQELKAEGDFIIQAAPTGRAAKRMTEITKREAKTIHRLLEFNPVHSGFSYDSSNPLPYKVIILDEASMIDIYLANSAFQAVDSLAGTKLILIGDVEQLPSIGPGNVLRDMIACGKINVIKLDVVKRQAEGSNITEMAHRVLGGQMIYNCRDSNDFFIISAEDKLEVADKMLECLKRLLYKPQYNYTIQDIQLICPQRTSEIGVEELNTRVQEIVNPPAEGKLEVTRGDKVFRVGDKVLHTSNNYEMSQYVLCNGVYKDKELKGKKQLGVFNGDTGIVINVIERKDEDNNEILKCLVVEYDDFIVIYDPSELSDVELAYAITIHKSQGSQYPVVIMPVHYRNYKMLSRCLGYTGLTRAKTVAALVGQMKAIKHMISNIEVVQRNTRLRSII